MKYKRMLIVLISNHIVCALDLRLDHARDCIKTIKPLN